MGEEKRWSREQGPKDVLEEFCNEFRSIWIDSGITDWLGTWTEGADGRELHSAVAHIHLTLRSLDRLLTAAYTYVDRRVAGQQAGSPDRELTALADITHELKVDVSRAKSFSDLLIQNQASEEKSRQDLAFLIRRLRRIDFLVQEAFPVILSGKDYLRELDLEKYRKLLQGD